jgi:hypothetical protein
MESSVSLRRSCEGQPKARSASDASTSGRARRQAADARAAAAAAAEEEARAALPLLPRPLPPLPLPPLSRRGVRSVLRERAPARMRCTHSRGR